MLYSLLCCLCTYSGFTDDPAWHSGMSPTSPSPAKNPPLVRLVNVHADLVELEYAALQMSRVVIASTDFQDGPPCPPIASAAAQYESNSMVQKQVQVELTMGLGLAIATLHWQELAQQTSP